MSIKRTGHLQANLYDKVFRENMLRILPGIIERVLNLKVVATEELKDDIQYTKERKTDLLKKVVDAKGNQFVLHVEYQTDDFADMHFRMAEYSIMLQRKHKLPARQYVVYIGPGKTTMPTTIKTDDLQFRYNLISLSSVDYKLFLKSSSLEERMLAILGKVSKNDQIGVLEKVLKDIKQTATDSLSEARYLQQLRILIKLRNLEQNLEEIMITISKYFKEENDPWFISGQKKGIEKGVKKGLRDGEQKQARETALKMLADNEPLEKIVRYTELSIEEIKSL